MRIRNVFFSPTGGGKKIADSFCARLRKELGFEVVHTDITPVKARGQSFDGEGILVFSFPVYGGRVPVQISDFLNSLNGNHGFAVPVAVYGNRDYDDALLECADILRSRGYRLAGAGAFVAEHSYSAKVGGGRPDAEDFKKVEAFAHAVSENISRGKEMSECVKGHRPYKPLSEFMLAEKQPPMPDGACISCGACARVCPQEIISSEDSGKVGSGCIACDACVKICPVSARRITDARILAVRGKLESTCTARRDAEYFV